ncbi:MAG: hypothetical protein WDN75_20385 [Bacteroidota bacterium]
MIVSSTVKDPDDGSVPSDLRETTAVNSSLGKHQKKLSLHRLSWQQASGD